MSSSVGSASRRTDCSISLGGGASRGGSTTCPSSNRVMVEEYFPNQYQDHICLLPEMGTSSLQGQRCNVKVYCVDIANRTFGELSYVKAQLSALLTCIDPNGNCVVELRCDLGEKNPRHNVWFRFKFDDQVRKVQILPLPLKTAFQFRQSLTSQQMVLQTLAVLLVVVSKRGGISVHSVVLSRTSDDDPFRIAEFKKVSRGSVAETGDSFDISLFLDNTHDVQDTPNMAHDTILYAGILPKSCSSQSHQLEVLACPLVCHKSPLFRFATTGPTRALRRSVVLTGCEFIKGISISSRRTGNESFCTVGILLGSELKVIRLPSLGKWATEALKLDDIWIIPFDESSVGEPTHLFNLRCDLETSAYISYLVVCQHPETNDAPQLHDGLGIDCEPSTVEPISSTEFQEKDLPPLNWAATQTRLAVLRAQRRVLGDVAETLQDEGRPQKGSLSNFEEVDDTPPFDQTPFHDENLDLNLESPESTNFGVGRKWIKRSISDSISSPLAGLTFGAGDDVNQASFRSITEKSKIDAARSEMPERSSCANFVHVSVPAKEGTSPTDRVRTDIFPVSGHFPSSFEALWIYELEKDIVVAPVTAGSSIATIHTVPFYRGILKQSPSKWDAPPPICVSLPDLATLKAVDFEIDAAGDAELWATTSVPKNIFHGHEDSPTIFCEHVVSFQSLKVPLAKTSNNDLRTSRPPKKRKSNSSDPKINEKLDMILDTLRKFEANVNEKLDVLEKRQTENTERLSKLEMSFNFRFTRAEI